MCFELCRKTFFRAVPLVAVALALTLAGCGKKGDPLPPLRDTPLRSDDLTIFQQGRLLVLETSYPAVTVSGMALDLPQGVTLTDTSWNVCFSSRGISDGNVVIKLQHDRYGSTGVEVLVGGTTRVLQ